MLLDQVTESAVPGRRGAPTAGGGLDHPPSLGGLVQGGQGVPGREGLAGLIGGRGMARTFPTASAVTAGSGPLRRAGFRAAR
ncbi:MAG: hypothetical protein JWM19_6506 [Actinomycetia bacterium]|nr:hypothetical protein [Actinomycetes bacterium]